MDNPRQDFLCVLCADNGRCEENKHGCRMPGGERGCGAAPPPCACQAPRWRGHSWLPSGPRGMTGGQGGGTARPPGLPPAPHNSPKMAAAPTLPPCTPWCTSQPQPPCIPLQRGLVGTPTAVGLPSQPVTNMAGPTAIFLSGGHVSVGCQHRI